jgi:hypothetical protein
MSVPSWPATLPQDLFQDGYSEALPNNLLRSPMDVGPAKVRRRMTSATKLLQGMQRMTPAELAEFIAFYEGSLLSGVLRFAWKRPLGGAAVEMRFTEPPSWTAISGECCEVSMRLEILP